MSGFGSWHCQCLSLAEIAKQMERSKSSVRSRALKVKVAIARDRNPMQKTLRPSAGL
jgi:DNA-directed RNA polymerase specialized sigma24 family protein